MLLDRRDLDLLRLIGLCKDLPTDCLPLQCDMFSQVSFAVLIGVGYIRKSKCGLSYRLTDKGHALLNAHGYPAEKDAVPVGSGRTLRKRLETAKVILSLYRCGVEVFEKSGKGFVFIPAFLYRRKGKGAILGASQLCGIMLNSKQTVAVYFITEQTKLNSGVETAAIKRIAALLQAPDNRVVLFFADDQSVLDSFEGPFGDSARKHIWGDAFAVHQKWPLYEPSATPLEVSIYA